MKNTQTRRKKRTFDLVPEEIAEIAASTRCLEAEARQANAEAALAEAETVRATHEATRAGLFAEAETCTLAERKVQHAAAMSGDVHHQVYRYTDAVDEETVADCMAHLTLWHRCKPKCDMEIIFTSPGGDVIAGLALFDYIQSLKHQEHKIITKTYGMAASMAGILLQAGTERVSGREAWVLIHEGAFGASGDAGKVEDTVNWSKRIRERIVNLFANRAAECLSKRSKPEQKTEKQVADYIHKNWARKDWWLSSDQMLALGFIDRVE